MRTGQVASGKFQWPSSDIRHASQSCMHGRKSIAGGRKCHCNGFFDGRWFGNSWSRSILDTPPGSAILAALRRVCCAVPAWAQGPPPMLHCYGWPPGADRAPVHPPKHQRRPHHQPPGRCPAHDTKNMDGRSCISDELGSAAYATNDSSLLDSQWCSTAAMCLYERYHAFKECPMCLNTVTTLQQGQISRPTVGMACVLTQIPAPSGRLGSAQRRTASSSDSGNTSGSSSLTLAALAAAEAWPAAPRC